MVITAVMAEQRRASTAGATGYRDHITSSTLHSHSHTTNGKRYGPSESGFTNNQRPVLGYHPTLDIVDNPRYGLLLFDNYITETKCQYQPFVYHDGSGSKSSFNDKNKQSGFYQLNGPQKPQSQNQTSEYQNVYVAHPLAPTVPLGTHSGVSHGKHSESGFTKGEDLQINTFMSKTCPPLVPRCTHSSITETDFQKPRLQRSAVIPNLSSFSSRDTSYSRGPGLGESGPSSPQPSPRQTQTPGLLRTMGKKEPSGFLHNAPNDRTYPLSPMPSSHFLTHYNSMFGPDSGLHLTQSQTTAGILHNKMNSGFNGHYTDRFFLRN